MATLFVQSNIQKPERNVIDKNNIFSIREIVAFTCRFVFYLDAVVTLLTNMIFFSLKYQFVFDAAATMLMDVIVLFLPANLYSV